MKVRSDFVTNSSSSSYVIAYRTQPDVDEETLKKYPWISECIKLIETVLTSEGDYGETNSGYVVNTVDDLDDRFLDYYSWSSHQTIEDLLKESDKSLQERYKWYKELIEKGYKIIYKNIDYSDSTLGDIIYNIEDGCNIIVLETD